MKKESSQSEGCAVESPSTGGVWGGRSSLLIDLTITYSPHIPGFSSEPAKTLLQDGWNATTLHLYSHAGTHMDAPSHFEVSNEGIDEIPVERLVSTAHVATINITHPKQLITVNDFASVAANIKPGESLIVKTGWYRFLGEEKYRNDLPRISEEAAHWLVQKRINILAVEPPSVADVVNLNEVTRIHQILLGGDIIIVEGLCNTEALTAASVQLIALPLKIKGGDGAPARVIAMQTV